MDFAAIEDINVSQNHVHVVEYYNATVDSILSWCIGVLRHMQRYLSYICDDTQMCRRIEEVVPKVGLPPP